MEIIMRQRVQESHAFKPYTFVNSFMNKHQNTTIVRASFMTNVEQSSFLSCGEHCSCFRSDHYPNLRYGRPGLLGGRERGAAGRAEDRPRPQRQQVHDQPSGEGKPDIITRLSLSIIFQNISVHKLMQILYFQQYLVTFSEGF